MDTLRTQTGELEFEVSGSGEPVLFVDGVLVTDTFRPVLAEPGLADTYRPIIYHRGGYGGSSPVSGTMSIVRHAADCRALLDHLGVERAHIVGHSYGGAIALQLALDAPAVVHSLAVLEPALMVGSSAQGYREALAGSGERYRQVGASVVVDEFLEARWPGYRSSLDRVLPGAFRQAVSDAATSFESELPGLLGWEFGAAEARRVEQPTLAVLGGASESLSPRFRETYEFLLAWIPHAEGFVAPGASHMMQLEDPHAIAEALATFWARHPIPDA